MNKRPRSHRAPSTGHREQAPQLLSSHMPDKVFIDHRRLTFEPRPEVPTQTQDAAENIGRLEDPMHRLAHLEEWVIAKKVIFSAIAQSCAVNGHVRRSSVPVVTDLQFGKHPYIPPGPPRQNI